MTTVENISKYLIYPSPRNPRKSINEESIKELATSIAKQGLLQPITVRPHDELDGDVVNTTYEIVCGERRYRALSLLSTIETVPCIVREMTDEEALDAMITENLQREDVDPIEEAEAFRLLMDNGSQISDLTVRFGKSESYVRDRISLAGLNMDLRLVMKKGLLPLRGAVMLSRLTQKEQEEFFEDFFDESDGQPEPDSMSVSEVSDWIANYFMKLWNAPFQEQGNLSEKWNPADAPVWQRCDTCQNNTACQNCLFPEMAKGEPRCTNRSCYERKRAFFYDLWLAKYRNMFLKPGEKPEKGNVVLYDGQFNYYNDQTKKRIQEWRDKLNAQGYRIMMANDFAGHLYNPSQKEIEEGLAAGTIVEGIDIADLGRGARPKIDYLKMKGEEEQERRENNMARSLAERLAKLRTDTNSVIDKELKKRLEESDYITRTGPLEEWEKRMQELMIFRMIPFNKRNEWIENYTPTYEEVCDFMHEHKGMDWVRMAIAAMTDGWGNQPLRRVVMEWVDPEGTKQLVMEKRNEILKREEDIIEELKAMGYDENGEKL